MTSARRVDLAALALMWMTLPAARCDDASRTRGAEAQSDAPRVPVASAEAPEPDAPPRHLAAGGSSVPSDATAPPRASTACAGELTRAARSAFASVMRPGHGGQDDTCQARGLPVPREGIEERVHFVLDADQCVPVVAVHVDFGVAEGAATLWQRRAQPTGWTPPVGDPATAMPVALPPSSFLDRPGATIYVNAPSAAKRDVAERVLRSAVDACLAP